MDNKTYRLEINSISSNYSMIAMRLDDIHGNEDRHEASFSALIYISIPWRLLYKELLNEDSKSLGTEHYCHKIQ